MDFALKRPFNIISNLENDFRKWGVAGLVVHLVLFRTIDWFIDWINEEKNYKWRIEKKNPHKLMQTDSTRRRQTLSQDNSTETFAQQYNLQLSY